MRRDSPAHERTCARWYDTDVDWVALNKPAITAVVPSEPDQALVIDASFVPTRGQYTAGLDGFWNGRHRCTEQGRAISTWAWLDRTAPCADGLRVEQTPPRPDPSEPEATRLDVYLDQLRRVVTAPDGCCLRDVVPDGASSPPPCVAGGLDVGLHQMGQWRAHAQRRDRSQGPKRRGPGRHKTDDGHVHVND
jgi:hypothetical protein